MYANDLGFMHSEDTVNILATYKAMETRTRLKKKKKWGFIKKYKMEQYEVEVERDVDLNFSLSAQFLPVVYGVDRIAGKPIFVDTKSNDPNNIFIVHSLCEGEIGGIYDLYIDDNPLMIANSDQWVNYDINKYINYSSIYDGMIMTMYADDPKWSFIAFKDDLVTEVVEKKLGVPVINPVKASILMAESLVKMKLAHSKLAYPTPAKKIIY